MSRYDNWTDEQVARHLARFHRPAVQTADVKPDVSNALDPASQVVQVDQKFRVRVTSKGRRLADTDGNSVKAVLDGITKVGIWRDDSSRFIEEISFTQETGKEDQTVVEIWEIEP